MRERTRSWPIGGAARRKPRASALGSVVVAFQAGDQGANRQQEQPWRTGSGSKTALVFGHVTTALPHRLNRRPHIACGRGQFTLVYECSKGLVGLPLFPIFSRQRLVVPRGDAARNSNRRKWIGSDLHCFGRSKSRMARVTRICHFASRWLFTMFWVLVFTRLEGRLSLHETRGLPCVQAPLRRPVGLLPEGGRNARCSLAKQRATACDARGIGGVWQEKGGPLHHDEHGAAATSRLRHVCVTSASRLRHLATRVAAVSYCDFARVRFFLRHRLNPSAARG